MFDNSRYRAIIKNEQRKVRATTGLCCSSTVCYEGDDTDSSNDIELLSRVLIDNGNCSAVNITGNGNNNINNNNDINNIITNSRVRSSSGLRTTCSCSSGNGGSNEIRTNGVRANERSAGSVRRENNDTNIYRFDNQNFLDNAIGKSNINTSGSDANNLGRPIEDILRRYGRNGRNRRNTSGGSCGCRRRI